MSIVFLLLGGNLGDRNALLDDTQSRISFEIGKILASSKIYESEPWGFEHSEPFLNQALRVETELEANEILKRLLGIEKRMGRLRQGGQYAARTMDIDILFIDNLIISTPALTVPHPRFHLRRFALTAMCDIAPDFVHPTIKRTIRILLEKCPDKSRVWRYSE